MPLGACVSRQHKNLSNSFFLDWANERSVTLTMRRALSSTSLFSLAFRIIHWVTMKQGTAPGVGK
jgi:hypothetical protein